MNRSIVASCSMRAFGKRWARSWGWRGWRVPGWRGGGGGHGKSGIMLYHCLGIWSSLNNVFVAFPPSFNFLPVGNLVTVHFTHRFPVDERLRSLWSLCHGLKHELEFFPNPVDPIQEISYRSLKNTALQHGENTIGQVGVTVDVSNLVTYLNRLPILEWYAVWCSSKNGYQKDVLGRDWTALRT